VRKVWRYWLLRWSTTGSKPSEPHGRQRDATSPQSSVWSKPLKSGRTTRTEPRSRLAPRAPLRWVDGMHRGMSTEGGSLNNPMRGALIRFSCFGEKAVRRAAQCSACLACEARVFRREAKDWRVCGVAEATPNSELVGRESGRERPTTHSKRVPAFVREAARQPESTPEGELQNPTTVCETL
jgi:hypothetical protein